ncbi:MAG: hypothetical protein Q8N81_00850, partial [bacterium]|nr:hypothetical protein [bacterium]
PGAYRYDAKEKFAERVEAVLFLHELPSEKYFLIFDSVPRPGQKILPNSTRMFKFFFPTSIIGGSNKIKPLCAEILNNFSHALRGTSPIQTSNQDAPLPKDLKERDSGLLEEDEADLE